MWWRWENPTLTYSISASILVWVHSTAAVRLQLMHLCCTLTCGFPCVITLCYVNFLLSIPKFGHANCRIWTRQWPLTVSRGVGWPIDWCDRIWSKLKMDVSCPLSHTVNAEHTAKIILAMTKRPSSLSVLSPDYITELPSDWLLWIIIIL